MKTTVILDDANYAYLVRRSVETYGSTKKISAIINDAIRSIMRTEKKAKEKNPWLEVWGTLKTKKTTDELLRTADEGWDS